MSKHPPTLGSLATLRPSATNTSNRGPAKKIRKRTHIVAHYRGGLLKIPLGTINWFMADDKSVLVSHSGGEVYIEESLKSLLADLSDDFLRIHRNALVPKKRIQSICGNLLKLTDSEIELTISRRHIADVRRFIKESTHE